MIKKSAAVILLFSAAIFLFLGMLNIIPGQKLISPVSDISADTHKLLADYSISNLNKRNYKKSDITLSELKKDSGAFSTYYFYFKSDSKRVSGLTNIPKSDGDKPVILMLRGYIDREKYSPGEGTRNTAENFAANGYITFAPDFLGYGESDNPSSDSLEERFQTYTTSVNLLTSLENTKSLQLPEGNTINIDSSKIGIWGHSNGGHIATALLEISEKSYPTVLWAPVSKPFPYSILYFTDEFEDEGKYLRSIISDFEKQHDVRSFSVTSFLHMINSPIQIHQGLQDEAVPQKWSDDFVSKLKANNIDVTYFTYPGENHNFSSGSFNLATSRSLQFFNQHLK